MTSITITITLPEGSTVNVGPAPAPSLAGSTPFAPPQLASLEGERDWVCPTHGSARVVPAGVSKRTGKPYRAFLACTERDCDEKEG